MRAKLAAALVCMLLLVGGAISTVSAQATVVATPGTPVTGEQITFSIGTTMDGMDATITTTGLAFESNTGLGNSNHVIVVGSLDPTAQYTYTVTAQPGETVSLILSDVTESDENGDEREGQRVTWFQTAQGRAEPSQEPSAEPSPSEQPSGEPSAQPSESAEPSGQPSQAPASQAPASEAPTQPPIAGNPSPTIAPGATVTDPGTTTSNAPGTGSGTITSGGSTGGGQGGSTGGGDVPQTGDLGHFWFLLGIMGILLVIVIVAGKRVFAED
ncbi:MAG: hypothetical protein HDQ87_12005 [Clostridia bacterium]|nr:hypothetical protein [Clostridia bacterium]